MGCRACMAAQNFFINVRPESKTAIPASKNVRPESKMAILAKKNVRLESKMDIPANKNVCLACKMSILSLTHLKNNDKRSDSRLGQYLSL